jgi:hypothetical protein
MAFARQQANDASRQCRAGIAIRPGRSFTRPAENISVQCLVFSFQRGFPRDA